MSTNYLLSEKTATGLKQLLADAAGDTGGVNKGKFTARVTGFVMCGSKISSGKYNGTIQVYNVAGDSWDSQDSCKLYVANGGELIPGNRYPATRYGMDDDKSVWLSHLEVKCIELPIDIVCVDNVMEVTKECFWIPYWVKDYHAEDVCCEPEV